MAYWLYPAAGWSAPSKFGDTSPEKSTKHRRGTAARQV